MQEGRTGNNENKIYACLTPTESNEKRVELFYYQNHNNTKKKEKIKSLKQQIDWTFSPTLLIELEAENSQIITQQWSGWIDYSDSKSGQEELIPEEHCEITLKQPENQNAYIFGCPRNNKWTINKPDLIAENISLD